MAYPYSRRNIPRNNQTQPRQRPLSSTSLDEEDHHLTSPTSAHPPSPLSPPRPFFLGSGPRNSSNSDRGSWSAASSAEVSDVESDRESPKIPPAIPRQPGVRSPAIRSTTNPNARLPASASRRRSSAMAGYAQVDTVDPNSGRTNSKKRSSSNGQTIPNPFSSPSPQSSDQSHETGEALGWDPTLLYQDAPIPGTPNTPGSSTSPRAPPSSFTFPFQAYPGNPDPGTHVPGLSSRRSSSESVNGISMHPRNPSESTYQSIPYSQSQHLSQSDLNPPFAPFMVGGGGSSGGGSNSVYRGSAAAAINSAPSSPIVEGNPNQLPRSSSTATFRAPFLSPASRPSSSLWSPPSYSHLLVNSNLNDPNSPSGSTSALHLALPKQKRPAASNRLPEKLTKEDKPWMTEREPRARTSWWLTFSLFVLGIAGAAVLCWQGMSSIKILKDSELCSVLDEDFSSGTLNTDTWNYDNELGGFE